MITMLSIDSNKIVYNHNYCQQCSVCKYICPKEAISLVLQKDGLNKVVIDHNKCILCKKCVNVCPANRQDNFGGYFEHIENREFGLGYNADDIIRRNSSSGGVCRTIIIESLKKGLADGVCSLHKTNKFPYAEGTFYTKENIPSYDDLPQSLYHSVGIGNVVAEAMKCNRLILVGTACQLYAMEKALRGKYNSIIKICILCKQQKSLDSTRFLAKIMGTKIPENLNFSTRYRGEGWPGIVKVNKSELPYSKAAQIPFGKRLWTVPGCNICGDPLGIKVNADITLLDPWNIRPNNDLGETVVVINTDAGKKLLKSIPEIVFDRKNFTEIEPSLQLKDIWRKQQLIAYFKGDECSNVIRKAGKAEVWQRIFIRKIVETLPRMPILFYSILNRLPDLRNLILNKIQFN